MWINVVWGKDKERTAKTKTRTAVVAVRVAILDR